MNEAKTRAVATTRDFRTVQTEGSRVGTGGGAQHADATIQNFRIVRDDDAATCKQPLQVRQKGARGALAVPNLSISRSQTLRLAEAKPCNQPLLVTTSLDQQLDTYLTDDMAYEPHFTISARLASQLAGFGDGMYAVPLRMLWETL
jgi:hypothetical protein